MSVTLVHIQVLPECLDAFIAATRANHLASVQEVGNLRFDVLQSPEDACAFILYEAYRSPEDAAAHKQTTHYATWRDAVAPYMATPRKGVTFRQLCP